MTAAITDFTQYADLRRGADGRDPAVLREVAGQFEALFLQSMLDSMRDASLGDSLFGDSDAHAMYRDMLDQQLSAEMSSGKGIGLAEMLVRQLGTEAPARPEAQGATALNRSANGREGAIAADADARWFPLQGASDGKAFALGGRDDPAGQRDAGWYPIPRQDGAVGYPLTDRNRTGGPVREMPPNGAAGNSPSFMPAISRQSAAGDAGRADSMPGYGWADPASFARDLWPHAQRVGSRLNIAPEAVMAQAALETGWGQHVMPRADGAISNNLFGIKANATWSGDSVARRTLEFSGGVARQETAQFRTYDDVAESFEDYAAFLSENPRYKPVLENGNDIEGFARAIADSGYATDPDYAEKISRVANGELMNEVLAPLKNASAASITE